MASEARCPRCGKRIGSAGDWPVTMPDGSLVGGCYRCFLEECDRIWAALNGAAAEEERAS